MEKKIKKLIKFNFFLFALNVLMFSNIGFHLRPFAGSGFIGTMVGLITILVTIELFITKNRKILLGTDEKKKENKNKTKVKDASELVSDDDFRLELLCCMTKRNFRSVSETSLRQLERMRKKVNVLDEILLQHFEKDSITYTKFDGTINSIEELFFDNLRKMIAKIQLFDQEEFNNMSRTNRNLSTESIVQRNAIYKEYVDYASAIVQKNETILVKLDELLSEISKLEEVEKTNVEELKVLDEVNELVGQVKFYKEALK